MNKDETIYQEDGVGYQMGGGGAIETTNPTDVITNTTDENTTPNILLFSSLFFITNIVTAFFKEEYLYSMFFLFLTITSLIFHSNNNIYTYTIDKIAIVLIVTYGSYILYNKRNENTHLYFSFIMITFFACVYLYYYGFMCKKYCFCDDKCIAQKYHFLMHIIVSIGHHMIIFL